jgi:hypothetical protein
MDRQIVYAGSIPLDTDLLNIQRNIQLAIGALAQQVLGTDPVVSGIGCFPGTDAYSVTVTPGSMTVFMEDDFQPFGALAPDPTQVMRTGSLLSNTELVLSGPGDGAYELCWLIQAQLVELDTGLAVLPYWNASNPSVSYSGPGNSGLAQATTRQLRVVLGSKSSGPQPLGAGVAPGPDAGWVGLFVVTTYLGRASIQFGDIAAYAAAPRVRYPLPSLPPAATQQVVFTTSGSWTAPPLVRWAKVRVAGAGGGGGGGDTSYSGGGGGAGGYAEAILSVVPGQSYAVVVGLGGAGGHPGASGGTGGTTSFGANLVVASGGTGGGASNPDSHGGTPGAGSGGTFLQAGGWGGDGAAVALIPGGTGGASLFGGGGRGAYEGGIPEYGLAAGSGGGGAYGPLSSGGAGSAGVVIVEY